MRHRLGWACVLAALVGGFAGCGLVSERAEQGGGRRVALSDLPPQARATVERLTAGGTVTRIDREEQSGAEVYDVEAVVGGKHVEYDVDAGGKVLTSEQAVPYASLPAAVRAAVEGHFGTGEGLTASIEQEGDKTFYEVEGTRDGVKTTLKLTEAGKIVETERE